MLDLHPASPLAASWSSQLLELKLSLDRAPLNSCDWYVRIRIKLLSFLLSRYGSDPNLRFERPEAAPPPISKCVIQKQDAKPLRSRAAIRKVLHRIAESNIPRLT